MELVSKNEMKFLVSCDAHNAILKKCDLVQGHLSVLLYSLQGFLQETDGDTGIYKAFEAVAATAEENFLELQSIIAALRPD